MNIWETDCAISINNHNALETLDAFAEQRKKLEEELKKHKHLQVNNDGNLDEHMQYLQQRLIQIRNMEEFIRSRLSFQETTLKVFIKIILFIIPLILLNMIISFNKGQVVVLMLFLGGYLLSRYFLKLSKSLNKASWGELSKKDKETICSLLFNKPKFEKYLCNANRLKIKPSQFRLE